MHTLFAEAAEPSARASLSLVSGAFIAYALLALVDVLTVTILLWHVVRTRQTLRKIMTYRQGELVTSKLLDFEQRIDLLRRDIQTIQERDHIWRESYLNSEDRLIRTLDKQVSSNTTLAREVGFMRRTLAAIPCVREDGSIVPKRERDADCPDKDNEV